MDHATLVLVLALVGLVALAVFCVLMVVQHRRQVVPPEPDPSVVYRCGTLPRGARDWVG